MSKPPSQIHTCIKRLILLSCLFFSIVFFMQADNNIPNAIAGTFTAPYPSTCQKKCVPQTVNPNAYCNGLQKVQEYLGSDGCALVKNSTNCPCGCSGSGSSLVCSQMLAAANTITLSCNVNNTHIAKRTYSADGCSYVDNSTFTYCPCGCSNGVCKAEYAVSSTTQCGKSDGTDTGNVYTIGTSDKCTAPTETKTDCNCGCTNGACNAAGTGTCVTATTTTTTTNTDTTTTTIRPGGSTGTSTSTSTTTSVTGFVVGVTGIVVGAPPNEIPTSKGCTMKYSYALKKDVCCPPFSNCSPISLNWNNKESLNLSASQFALDNKPQGKWFQWFADKSHPLVVIDKKHNGKITSAEQLFGNFTFGKEWHDGYEALATLDTNSDGKISGIELKDLALWFDENKNGISEVGEVKSLEKINVTALFYKPSHTDLTGNHNIHAKLGFERTINNRKIYGSSVDWFGKGGFDTKEEALKGRKNSELAYYADLKGNRYTK